MISVPATYLAAANSTHAPLWRVRMVAAGGAQIGDPLPFTGGTITKTNEMTPRCRATIDVPTQMIPALIDQAYLPTGQRLLFEYSIKHLGPWITVADLDMVSSQITRPDSVWTLEAADRSIRIALDDTARGAWVEPEGFTIGSAVMNTVARTFSGTVFDITGPANSQLVPIGTRTDGDPWSAMIGLATAAQSEVFMRAHDRVCVVRPLPELAAEAVDTIGVGEFGNVTVYTIGHEMGWNHVSLVYQSSTGGDTLLVGNWTDTRPTSPVALQRIGTHVVYRETRKADAAPTQAEADAAAAALGTRVAGRSRSPSIRHVSRPWLEPGDTIAVTYAGGPTELQLIDSVDIPLDNSNIQTTVARNSAYQMEAI